MVLELPARAQFIKGRFVGGDFPPDIVLKCARPPDEHSDYHAVFGECHLLYYWNLVAVDSVIVILVDAVISFHVLKYTPIGIAVKHFHRRFLAVVR